MIKPSAPPIALDAHNWSIVQSILQSHLPHTEVWAFGSRARGTPKPYSDLDLVIMGDTPTPLSTLGQLQEAFACSDLPWRVDVVDWANTAPEFQRHIQADSVSLAQVCGMA